jgi:hypothetical protein
MKGGEVIMKRILLVAVVALGVALGGIVYAAGSRITFADMDAIYNPSAEARVKVNDNRDGTHDFSATVRVQDLPTDTGVVYEGWLVDDPGTGYKLSLGAFTTNHNGRENFTFRQTVVNVMLYDKLVITREPVNDADPNPATPVLSGDLVF